MKPSLKTKKNKAFTLVEFLVVVIVIGLLFLAISAFTGNSTDKAKESGVLTDLRAWETAIHQVGIEYGEFTNDLNKLSEQINANVDAKLLVRVVGDKLIANKTDPWGTEYQIRYSKSPTDVGKLTVISAGSDLKFDSFDDMGTVITYKLTADGTKMETSPLIPGTSNDNAGAQEHICVFNKTVKSAKYLKTAGNCTEEAIYYKSCTCGKNGSETFVGEKDPNTHISSVDKQYSSPNNETHTTTLICSGCETVLDIIDDNHTFEGNVCVYCNYERHEHVYDQQVKTETYIKDAATCNSKAVYYYSCQCGQKGTTTFEYGEKLTHTYSGVITSYPTCTTEGVKTFTCMLCGHSYTEKVAKYAHSYINKNAQEKYLKSAATCTSKAIYYKSCTCGEQGTETFEHGNLAAHTMSNTVSGDYLKTAATCVAKAIYYKSCSVCGIKDTATFEDGEFNANNHIGEESITYEQKDASQHTKKVTCDVCHNVKSTTTENHTMNAQNICTLCEQHNHNYNQQVVASKYLKSDATCTSKAVYYKSCVCGEKGTTTFESGTTTAHNMTNTVNSTYLKSAATCTSKAVYYKSCSVCGTKDTVTFENGNVDMTNHVGNASTTYESLNATQHTKKVTCDSCHTTKSTTTENHTFNAQNTCTLCDNHVHNYNQQALASNYLKSEATCTSKALYYYSCVCGEKGTETFSYGVMASHSYNAQTISDTYLKAAATCTSKAVYYKSCTSCGAKGTTTFEFGNVNTNNHIGTAVYGGTLSTHTKCNECGEAMSSAHTYQSTIIAEATCTAMGSTKYICDCGYGYTIQNIDPLGHIDADNNNVCERCGLIIKFVEGLGDVGISGNIKNPENIEFEYNPDDGNVSVLIPPVNNQPETPPEIPEENLPNIIEFGNGKFDTTMNYTPGEYKTVPYEFTRTTVKYPVPYYSYVWSSFLVTKDQDGNIINTQSSPISLSDIDETYSTYIVYCFSNEYALSLNGVEGDSMEVYAIFNASDDKLSEAIYLAGFLKLSGLDREFHVAKLENGVYVDQNVDDKINNVTSIYETYTVTGNSQVMISAPSTVAERVYVPIGALKAEEGMTWREWLASPYNTTGFDNPQIKTDAFEDVSLDDVIVPGKNYAIMNYSLSGVWRMNDFITEWYGEEILINFTSNGIEFMGMFIMAESTINYLYANEEDAANDYYNGLFYDRYPLTSQIITTGWWYDEGYQTIDLGPDPQPVSMEIYEWFVSNAKQEGYEYIKGTWLFNDEIDLQGLNDVCSQEWINNGETDDAWRFYIDFISNGMRFNYMATGDGTIATVPCSHGYEMLYGTDDDSIWSYAFNYGEGVDDIGNQHWWSNEAYKTIDFGTTYQRVPTEFYEWLLENAQPCLTGAYQFKDIVIMFYDAVSISMNGNFVSNNTEFSSISIEQSDEFPSHLIIKYGDIVSVDCKVHNQALEPSAHLTYTNSNYSKIDFGDNVVPVSLEFYKWIMRNTYME